MIVVGSMIGSGIFIVSADIARTVGSTGWLLAVWLVTGLVTVTAALSYGELAGMMPQAGGQYVYLREAFNPLIGFLYGWTLFLVIQSGFNAAVSIGFAKALASFLPAVSEKNILVSAPLADAIPALAGLDLPGFLKVLTINAAQLVACGVIIVLTGINMLGVREGSLVQNILTTLKVAGLAALICESWGHASSAIDHFQPILPGPEVWEPAALAALAVALSRA